MTREEMKTALDNIELLEKDLMRSLTSEEEEIVLAKGWKALFEKLGFDEDDYKTFRRIEALISAFCTESEERYEEELAKDNGSARFVLQSIVNDLEAKDQAELLKKQEEVKVGEMKNKSRVCSKCDSASESTFDLDKMDPDTEGDFKDHLYEVYDTLKPESFQFENLNVDEYVKRLIDGETLTLDSDTMNQVVDWMWNSDMNFNIQIIDNIIRLKK
ncbi:MAG: hypothetical protein Q4C49_00110 [Bacillota bacterium]|nr:hypothetical protein [Bacillota bacterium]